MKRNRWSTRKGRMRKKKKRSRRRKRRRKRIAVALWRAEGNRR